MREMKKRLRDVPVVNGSIDTTKAISPTSSKNDLSSSNKEEVTGLKHIIQELQKENSSILSKVKMLESENHLMRSETEQLQQEVRILEESLDGNISGEEAGGVSPTADISLLQRRFKDQALELEQLKKKMSESEMKHGRATHDLNKEISELEALVESKIYKEDELEQEIERLKDKISRAKKSSKSSAEPSTSTNNRPLSIASSTGSSDGPVCEICERPGHDIFNCDLLKDDGRPSTAGSQSSQPFCEDCETPGHTASECPYSHDVF
ncbi:hypothetical protein FA15DRAFT_514638 [Coprinopsis marcescibilis]|uniref:CLIP1 zinc knuckle domain-containing protein n=1 Tax=Coprinopsis marcescibilis TaxID=230819 RepID=A0A5C3KQ03_COPMA|nr:hypothetical protein FA15DRAFT_514638 [Coprinopsis marcescibilis]